MPDTVDDPGDPRLRPFTSLNDAALRRSVESEAGVFVVEGPRSVRRLLGSRWPLRSVLLARERLGSVVDIVSAAEAAGADVLVASPDVIAAVVGFPFHRGVLAIADRLDSPDAAELARSAAALLVIEGVNDHENLGALFRSAAALGADGILLDPRCCDPLYRRSVRVSMGNVLTVPFARMNPWPGTLRRLRDWGFVVVALSPSGESTIGEVADQVKDRRVAVLVGSEGDGLSAGALAASSMTARVPMVEGVDSLNVATAAAIGLHRLVGPGIG